MDYTPPRDYTPHPLTAVLRLIPLEGDIPAKRIDPEYMGENYVSIQESNQAFRGCGGAGRLTVLASGALFMTVIVAANWLDAEMRIQVNDGAGGHAWEVQADADDQFTINAAGRIYGGVVPNYAALVVADLYWETIGSTNHRRMVGAAGIALGNAPGGFTGDDLPRSAAAPGVNVDAALTVVEARFGVEHDADGGHTDDFLQNDYIDPEEAFVNEGFVNLLNNSSFEHWNNGIIDIAPDEWEAILNAASVISRDSVEHFRGDYSCEIDSRATGDYIRQTLASSSEYANLTLSGSVAIKGDAGRVFSIYLWGDVSGVGTVTMATLTGGVWDTFYFTNDMGNDTVIQLRIVRDDLTDSVYFTDAADVKVGRLIKDSSLSPFDSVILTDDREPYNFLLNPNFDHWQETNETPMAWEPYAAGVITIARVGFPEFGAWRLDLTPGANGEGISQRIGDMGQIRLYLQGKTITYSAYVVGAAATTYRIQIDDGVGTSENDFDIGGYLTLTRISVTHTVDMAATGIDCNIFRNDAVNGNLISISNACLNVGSRPLDVIGPTPSVWTARDYVFDQSGSVVSGTILGPIQQEIMETVFPTYMSVKVVTAGAIALTAFELQINGVASGFVLTLAIAGTDAHEKQATLAAVNTDNLAADDYIDIMPTQLGGALPQDVRVVLRGYTLTL